MKLAVHMNEQAIKQVKGFLTCCAKIGTVLLIEASPSQMRWRTINSAKSCCILITLESTMFQHYVLYTVTSMNASVLLKHLLSAFRTPKIKQVEMEIQDGDLLTITVDSESGLHKTYKVACVDEEHLVATFDRDTLPTSITADAFQLSKVLSSFQTSLDEVTLLARPEGNGNMQPIQLASYVPPAKQKLHQRKGGLLRTHIQIDTRGRQLFKHYRTSSDETLDATFNVKDFAVLVQLCKQVQADVAIHMGPAGTPLLAEAAWASGTAASASHLSAEVLLATIAESVQDALADIPPLGGTPGAPRGTPGGVPTPSGAASAPGTIRAAAEAARAAAPPAPRSLDPAALVATPHARHAAPPEAALATPAAVLRQPSHLAVGPTAGPARGSGTQSGARESHDPAHTPPNLGGRDSGVSGDGWPDGRSTILVQQKPVARTAAHSSQFWGSAAHTSQDSSPHIDATFGAAVGAAPAQAPVVEVERIAGDGDAPDAGGGADAGEGVGADAGAHAEAAEALALADMGGGDGHRAASDAAGTQVASGGHVQGDRAPDAPRAEGGGVGDRAETSRFASHLERLAAAIRQDEEVRNAQKASIEAAATLLPSADGTEKVSMRAQVEDDAEELEGSEGEFAADDDEEDCLATPPDARPETVFM
eukprot:jgi/Ulvmu1/1391/UM011_0119.1